MRKNAFLLFAVSCLVALAGCSGALSDATGGAGPTLDDVSYPDGVSENGTDAAALADGHRTALENESFTLSMELSQNSSMGNQSVQMDAAVGADRDDVRANVSALRQQVSMYLTSEKQYTKTTVDNRSMYRVQNRTPRGMQFVPASYTGARYVEQFASNVSFQPTGVREVDGTKLIVLRANESAVTAPDRVNVTEYNGTLLVDEQGLVHRFDVQVTTEQDGQRAAVGFSFEISDVGETTVEEPNWLDEAKNRSEN